MAGGTVSFLHSGDMGDIVAGMAAVKEFCERNGVKAQLKLDVSGAWTNPLCLRQSKGLGMKFGPKQYEFLKPLLEVQPYIQSVSIYGFGETVDFDLNGFRNGFCKPWRRETGKNLLYNHQKLLGLPLRYNGPWLTLPGDKPEVKPGWLAARSTRYHSSDQIFRKHADEIKAFVGTPLEAACYDDCLRQKPEYILTETALDLARAIMSYECFVVNGTLAFWIALGLGHPHIINEVGVNVPSTVFREDICGLEYAQGAGVKRREELAI